ncbi:uncharacterized protein LOC108680961 [Hyalella azteca]|uniref:Uncharacterized protein LOC108680961 n=1 Tax=Hyalella azteca TaxID=294128 RepID=A0A8B7PIQ0_HYAAZ|nr:uncharacterized protein LOC108680961 [Hyalella azteca]
MPWLPKWKMVPSLPEKSGAPFWRAWCDEPSTSRGTADAGNGEAGDMADGVPSPGLRGSVENSKKSNDEIGYESQKKKQHGRGASHTPAGAPDEAGDREDVPGSSSYEPRTECAAAAPGLQQHSLTEHSAAAPDLLQHSLTEHSAAAPDLQQHCLMEHSAAAPDLQQYSPTELSFIIHHSGREEAKASSRKNIRNHMP